MSDVRFVDTTLRDGQQSLWALRMRTEVMSPALEDLDRADLLGAEAVVGTQFVRAVRTLHEDPWEWVRCLAGKVRTTPLRMVGGSRSYFSKVPACIEALFLDRLSDLGVRTSRSSDPWNDFSDLGHHLRFFADHGVETVVVNVIYSVSPRHTVAYYEDRVRAAVAAGAHRLCLKDVGGLLTPAVAAELVPAVLRAAGAVPVEFHAHCNNGFAPYCALMAVDAGIRTIHTAIPPLANGSSQPSVFSVARNLAARGHTPIVNLAPLERVSEHLAGVARAEGLPVGHLLEYEEGVYRHQLPGGMRATLADHLAEVGIGDRFDETLEEAARVRQDLGYPIMVTPLSQFVGSQAALNVICGRRYQEVSDEIIGYALGRWGREALDVMDPDVRHVILDRPRAAQLEAHPAAEIREPTLSEVRREYGSPVSDEELVLRVLTGSRRELGLQRRPVCDTYEEYGLAHDPVMSLIAQVADLGIRGRVEYHGPGGELVIERGRPGRVG